MTAFVLACIGAAAVSSILSFLIMFFGYWLWTAYLDRKDMKACRAAVREQEELL